MRNDSPMSRNWVWILGTLLIWAAIFFAFLLIAIQHN
jgi:hypothetical protein